MNTGWVTYGILLIVAAFLVFDLRKGVRPVGIVILTGPGQPRRHPPRLQHRRRQRPDRLPLLHGRRLTGWMWNIRLPESAAIYPTTISRALLAGTVAARRLLATPPPTSPATHAHQPRRPT
ncbi:hypothetical protein ACGFOM_10995 [Streptomyces sp. NPDC048594]|uniref:hypothetical protein n=1 Tax=Streptomyces sp. NPDC048594 TaxID=3365575 RepID=UPI00371AE477